MTEQDPFGRPLDTSPPIVLTPEQAKAHMAEVAAEEEMSADELAGKIKDDRDFEIAMLEAAAEEASPDLDD